MEANRKTHKVHMLPTEDKSHIVKHKGKLNFGERAIFLDERGWSWTQHLYFTTDEEIKEGVNQYYIDKFTGKLSQSGGAQYGDKQDVVIATTDPKLIKSIEGLEDYGLSERIAQINQDFIKAYCEQGGIDEVDVEYNVEVYNVNSMNQFNEWHLKVDSNNTVITHLIEEKMYSLDVVRKAYLAGWVRGDLEIQGNPNEWIKENL